jgi:IMP dehydrogenase
MSDLHTPYLTYDDVLLKPGYSEVLPHEVSITSRFSRNISLSIPIVSAAMDTVTESRTAIVMAQEGGLGVIHKNLTAYQQAGEVEKVKKYESGMIVDPVTIKADDPLTRVLELTKRYKIGGLPVIDDNRKLIGILTNRDLRFETNFNQKVADVMTKENLITAPQGTTLETAKSILQKHKVEKLPVVDGQYNLIGLITIKDINKAIAYPNSNKDSLGRLRVAAAIGVGDKEYERARILAAAQVDALVVDTAHGHSRGVFEMVRTLKKDFPTIDIVAGNIATGSACLGLIEAGVDSIKVGIGPGSICTTRVVAGIGVPQFSAVVDCYSACKEADVPFIADGGIKFSGDVVKALAAGASSVMIGSLFAGADETPGEMVLYQGRSYKVYRGMGSLGAMSLGSKDRYGQASVEDNKKLVPEGIEGQVPYRGSLSSNVFQLVGGVRSGMGYIGARDLEDLKQKADFITITAASLKEGHPHDIMITKEAPNYQVH